MKQACPRLPKKFKSEVHEIIEKTNSHKEGRHTALIEPTNIVGKEVYW